MTIYKPSYFLKIIMLIMFIGVSSVTAFFGFMLFSGGIEIKSLFLFLFLFSFFLFFTILSIKSYLEYCCFKIYSNDSVYYVSSVILNFNKNLEDIELRVVRNKGYKFHYLGLRIFVLNEYINDKNLEDKLIEVSKE